MSAHYPYWINDCSHGCIEGVFWNKAQENAYVEEMPFSFFGSWSRLLQMQAIRMVYVTANLSVMAILAHPIITLPLLLAFDQVAYSGNPGF